MERSATAEQKKVDRYKWRSFRKRKSSLLVALSYSRVRKYAFKRDKNIEQPDAGCRSPGHENRAASSRPPARGLEEFQALVLGSIFKCAHCRSLARTLRSLPNEFFDVTDFPCEKRTSFTILRRIITANKLIIIGITVARVSFSFDESYERRVNLTM